jgi:hypothetical protein
VEAQEAGEGGGQGYPGRAAGRRGVLLARRHAGRGGREREDPTAAHRGRWFRPRRRQLQHRRGRIGPGRGHGPGGGVVLRVPGRGLLAGAQPERQRQGGPRPRVPPRAQRLLRRRLQPARRRPPLRLLLLVTSRPAPIPVSFGAVHPPTAITEKHILQMKKEGLFFFLPHGDRPWHRAIES